MGGWKLWAGRRTSGCEWHRSHGTPQCIDLLTQRQPARLAGNRMEEDCRARREACLVNCWRSGSLAHRLTVSLRYLIPGNAIVAALLFAGVILCPAARGAQKDKDKEKPEKEKKEKIEPWV